MKLVGYTSNLCPLMSMGRDVVIVQLVLILYRLANFDRLCTRHKIIANKTQLGFLHDNNPIENSFILYINTWIYIADDDCWWWKCRLCNMDIISHVQQVICFAFHDSRLLMETCQEAKNLRKIVTLFYLDWSILPKSNKTNQTNNLLFICLYTFGPQEKEGERLFVCKCGWIQIPICLLKILCKLKQSKSESFLFYEGQGRVGFISI